MYLCRILATSYVSSMQGVFPFQKRIIFVGITEFPAAILTK